MKAWEWVALLLASAAPLGAQTPAVAPPPRLGSYLDTASLRESLAALPARPAGKRAGRIFRIAFDAAGRPLPAEAAVPRAMPELYQAAVIPLIQAALRPIPPRNSITEMLILVDAGHSPRIEEISPPQQPPRVLNNRELARAMEVVTQELFNAFPALEGRTVSAMVAMTVGEDGSPSSARLAASSGMQALDDAALRTVQIIRFQPGLVDGEPTPLRVLLPFRIIFQGNPEPAKPRRP
jgi:TonB family protein